jgi:radical SAM protein with 4Fe4S-binding SPASM domain
MQNANSSYGKKGDPNSLPPISSAFFVLTQRCNLSCKYCFVEQKDYDMSYQIAKDATDFLAANANENNPPSINFFGGEPLLRWDDIIVPLSLYIRSKYPNFKLSLTTNGILLDKEKLEFMKRYDIGHLFSIDGNKETQDLNRPCKNGKSSFDILKDKIPMVLEYQPNGTFRSTIDHDTKDIIGNFKFAVESGFKNIFAIVNVFCDWTQEEKDNLKEQIEKLGDYYIELLIQGRDIIISPLQDFFQKIQRAKQAKEKGDYRSAASDCLSCGRCGLGSSKFASVGCDGTLFSCQEMTDNEHYGDTFKIGNIYTGVDNEKRYKLGMEFDIKSVKSDTYNCRECPLDYICDGACTINNYFKNKDLHIMPGMLCYYYKLLYEQAQKISDVANMYQQVTERFKKKKVL